MYHEKNGTITGCLTRTTATYQQGDPDDRLRAIERVEKAEHERQRKLEPYAGRELKTNEILKGSVEHPETRSTRELQRLRIKPTPTAEPVDGEALAIARLERQVEDSKLSIRERQLKRMKEERAARQPEPEPPTPEAVKLMDEARLFIQTVKFTPQATVEMVERADALMDIAKTGDADRYRAAIEGLAMDIRCVLTEGMADAEANITAIRDRAGLFDVAKPKPAPVVNNDDSLGSELRKAHQKFEKAKELV